MFRDLLGSSRYTLHLVNGVWMIYLPHFMYIEELLWIMKGINLYKFTKNIFKAVTFCLRKFMKNCGRYKIPQRCFG